MSRSILIKKKRQLEQTEIRLSPSKSESNRALIINALAGNKANLTNLSDARDTTTMLRLLTSADEELNVLDAGTTMRFLTAYCSIKPERRILTGTPRMNERPIKILVSALTEIGADIAYLGKPGYPPLEIKAFKRQLKNRVKAPGNVSSQYISALLMIAPKLPEGLTLELTGEINSRPYIEMTIALMKKFGVNVSVQDDRIFQVSPQDYQPVSYQIESDWSGASYWYSFTALAEEATFKLAGLKQDSLQGDRIIADHMEKLGVQSEFDEGGVVIRKGYGTTKAKFNFSHCPDLGQTIAVACAAKGIPCEMTGLESLKIKETDRITALQNELAKIGSRLDEESPGVWRLTPGDVHQPTAELVIKTYDDHRMAMAFAPLAALRDVVIQEPDVVQKSYPGFWSDMKKAGFEIIEK